MTGVDPTEFQRYFVELGRSTAGTATRYAPSLLIGDAVKADGRWRLFAFAGTDDPDGITAFCDFIAEDPSSPLVELWPELGDGADQAAR